MKRKGFSIIEVIFAILLTAVALVVYAASLNLVPLTKSTKYQNIAYHLAIKRMELLRNTDYASLPASGPISDSDLILLPSGQAELTIINEAAGLKKATISVSWMESSGTKLVRLDTFIYESGLNTL